MNALHSGLRLPRVPARRATYRRQRRGAARLTPTGGAHSTSTRSRLPVSRRRLGIERAIQRHVERSLAL